MMFCSQLPTSRADWYRTGTLVWTVVSHPKYAALAFVVGLSNIAVFIAGQNVQLVRDVVLFGSQLPTVRASVFVNLFPIVVFQLRRESVTGAAGTWAAGVLLGTAGVGCAACGISLVAAITGATGASVVAVLPFGGNEFVV